MERYRDIQGDLGTLEVLSENFGTLMETQLLWHCTYKRARRVVGRDSSTAFFLTPLFSSLSFIFWENSLIFIIILFLWKASWRWGRTFSEFQENQISRFLGKRFWEWDSQSEIGESPSLTLGSENIPLKFGEWVFRFGVFLSYLWLSRSSWRV